MQCTRESPTIQAGLAVSARPSASIRFAPEASLALEGERFVKVDHWSGRDLDDRRSGENLQEEYLRTPEVGGDAAGAAEVDHPFASTAVSAPSSPEAVERTAGAIAEMSGEAKRRGVRAVVAVGTAGLRIAGNSAAVLDAIRGRTGISVEVLPGEEEGRLAYLAVKAGLQIPEGAIVVPSDCRSSSSAPCSPDTA
jgi:Ppx/GppA phosphatase family